MHRNNRLIKTIATCLALLVIVNSTPFIQEAAPIGIWLNDHKLKVWETLLQHCTTTATKPEEIV